MLKRFLNLAALALVITALNSCVQDQVTINDSLSADVLQKITNLGFSADGAFAYEDGVIVEGDIFLTKEDLARGTMDLANSLLIADEEQYHTTNLVTGTPRTIVVSTSGNNITAALSTAINDAINRYNAENLSLTFVRGGSSGGGNINIRVVNTGQYIASAGFPSGGNPYHEIKYAKTYNNYSNGFMTTVLAHEMGHCIGFRHTDYMNRSYSCGTGGNEGSSGVGAIHIPGTPTGPDAASWMLACLSATTNRPFNANDKIALAYLY
ncbi:MAG: M57 family metalloprotease [Saprospiraceae bacterium]